MIYWSTIIAQENTSIQDDKIYNANELSTAADFKGGIMGFYQYLAENYIIPEAVKKKGGKIFIKFVVEKDGTLSTFETIKDDVGKGAANDAIKILEKCPRWNPGTIDGKSVRSYSGIPIIITNY